MIALNSLSSLKRKTHRSGGWLVKEYNEIHLKVFLELLRTYHNGIGVTHAAQPQEEVGYAIGKEASAITKAYLLARDKDYGH